MKTRHVEQGQCTVGLNRDQVLVARWTLKLDCGHLEQSELPADQHCPTTAECRHCANQVTA